MLIISYLWVSFYFSPPLFTIFSTFFLKTSPKSLSEVLQDWFKIDSRVIQEWFKRHSRVIQESFKSHYSICQESIKYTFRYLFHHWLVEHYRRQQIHCRAVLRYIHYLTNHLYHTLYQIIGHKWYLGIHSGQVILLHHTNRLMNFFF